ncbi:DUF6531 domain-containing protein [Aquimarina litoralis]|uniref:DUF6531 domain-containing protein n=1 Tax=Aquimarina litoralis TaxID=584605 RepID=UPI001C56CF42|nr:DUF6531 domain-containing protein [Aquimarina litoralis]MBW1296417.1 type IV secretion protein Rhs [Aquimarina litoralis]
MSVARTTFFDNMSRNISNTVQGDPDYFGSFTNMNLTTGHQIQSIAGNVDRAIQLLQNDNLSASTQVTAQALNILDTAIQGAMAFKSLAENIAETAVLPVLSDLGMTGMASLPVAKQLDPVMGVDMHMVVFPPLPAPIPIPHPYIGILFRPKDFISSALAVALPPPPPPPDKPVDTDAQQTEANIDQALTIGHTVAQIAISMIGATVLIEGIPRAVAGTPTLNIVPHFPIGPSFHPNFLMVEKNKGHAFMGSLLALADNYPISGGASHMHNNCWDIGIPSINSLDDSQARGLRFFAPTGLITSIPMSSTILTNPVPSPKNPMAIFQVVMSRLLHGVVRKVLGRNRLAGLLHRGICMVTGHPVDVASGMFFTDEEDFSLPGPIPLSWERVWYSKSDYKGPLGNGWHHSYDIALAIDKEEGIATLRLEDGRPIVFVLPETTIPSFNKAEKIQLLKNEEGEYYAWNIKEEVFYYFTKTQYNDQHLLRSIVNKNSFSIQFKYDRNGYLIEIIDSAHRKLQVINDINGRILEIFAPNPNLHDKNKTFVIASYTYDKKGNMIQQTNAVGDAMHFEYDGYLMVKEVWRNGLTWYFRYDGTEIGSRCIHTWGDGDLYNHKLTYEEGKTIVENSLGQLTTYYHKGGLVYKKVDANDAEHYWIYDKDNQLLSETDPMGNSHLYAYDDFGNKTKIIDPTGATISTDYINPKTPHLPVEAKDANGGTWQWEYDEQGNVVKRTNPMGASSELLYQDGLLQSITDPLGNSSKLQYDKYYNISVVTDNQGNSTKHKYDVLGRCVKTINAKGATQTREFDLLGRVIRVKDYNGNHIELGYDGIDNLISYKDDLQEVKYRYAGMWKMTSRADQRGTTLYQYNTEEQLTKIINENKQPFSFELDDVGNVVKEISFDESTKLFKRDPAGRVVEITKASGKKVRYEYDSASRVTEIIHQDDDVQSFEYNAAGQLITAINKDAEVTFTRNQLGLITEEAIGDYIISHQYNARGVRIGLQSSLGANIKFEHDNFGNLANLKASHEENQWEANYRYDSLGFELERLLPGKLQQNFSYDTLGRLTSQLTSKTNKQKHKRQYTWGKSDRLHKVQDSSQGTTVFGYAPTGHLEKSSFGNGAQQHRLADQVGNLYETPDKNDRTYGIGGRLEKKGSWHYVYDQEGFLIEKYKGSSSLFKSKKDHWRYQWNNEGMLQQVTRPDGHAVAFTYDALGRRLSKTFKNTITKWLWDGNTPLHEWKEHLQTGQVLSNSTVGDNGIITWVFEENSFIPTAKLKGTKKYSILVDHLGTPSQMYDEEGASVWERSLDSYGKPHYQKGGQGSCSFMYQGQYEDAETGLYYNRFRYYDPEDGRYISVDPIGLFSEEYNFYVYVDNPNNWVDEFGLKRLYALVASEDGWYPVMQWGQKEPIGEMFLRKGELWKIGESIRPRKRYSGKWLKRMKLNMVTLSNGHKKLMQMLERMKLKGHRAWKGHLPPGNKCCH